jgi:transcriptional regulator with XRE-family HTH domain
MDPPDVPQDDSVLSLIRMMHGSSTVASVAHASVSDVSASDAPVSNASTQLGPRLRTIRLGRGLSLRELARRVDLSPSAVSQIETGKMQPSVRTLYALVSEFGVTVDEVLFDQAPAAPDAASTSAPESSPAAAGPGLAVERAGRRPAITLNSGVTWERLMFWADEDVEFIEATYEPGGASGPSETLVRHSGHEFGYLLSGTLRVVVGFDDIILGPGDSITFPSSTPHRLSNEGEETARAIWVVRGRRGSHSDTEMA